MPKQQATLGGWLSVKKRGKDDDAIERDRSLAVEAKRRKRLITKKPPTTKKSAPQKAAPKKTKRRKQDDDSESSDFEDDDSLEGFVVDDDEDDDDDDDLVEDEEGSSQDELEIVHAPPPRRSNKAPMNMNKNKRIIMQLDSSSSSSSSSDEEGGTFFQSHEARSSKPSHALQRASVAAKTRPNAALKAPPTSTTIKKRLQQRHTNNNNDLKNPPVVKKNVKSTTTSDDDSQVLSSPQISTMKEMDDDDTDDDSPPPTKSKYFAKAKVAPTKTSLDTDDSDDDNDDDDLTPIKPGRNKQVVVNVLHDDSSPEFQKKTLSYSSTGDDAVLDSLGQVNAKSNVNAGGHHKRSLSDSDSSIEESLGNGKFKMVRRKQIISKKNKPSKQKQVYDLLSSDNDDDDHLQQAIRQSLSSDNDHVITNASSNDDDDDNANDNDNANADDPDEQVALRFAMKQSKKDAKKMKANQKSAEPELDASDDAGEEPETLLLDETSDEEEDIGEDYDEGKKAAISVLETAEQLSAQVLGAMTKWTRDDDDDGNSKGPAATQGMIVDGALSLSALEMSSNLDNSQVWISQKAMQQIIPDVKLSNYQLVGVNWLALLHGMKCNIEGNRDTNVNGVLADEMGLGKTVQTIAFLAWLKHQNKTICLDGTTGVEEEANRLHLIVVPVSVLSNWMREFETFCPDMNVVKYHGSQKEREEIKDHLKQFLPGKRSRGPQLDVILTPMTYFQIEKSIDRSFLNKFKYDYLVVDEAHMLKNSQSTRYKMLNKVVTHHRLLLTGTPVQNSPQELLNMLCFLMPLFSRGTKSFDDEGNESVGDRMLQHFVDEKRQEEGDEESAYKKLKQLFAPFVLRRKKDDVLHQIIPPKEKVVEFVELDKRARDIYDSILEAHINKTGTKTTAAIGDHLFTNLRKAAHHPLLLRARHNSPEEIEHLTTYFHRYGAFKGEGSTKARVAEELSKFNDFHIHLTALELIDENKMRRNDLERYTLDEDSLFSSAKFERLRTMLPNLVADGHRILIFSVWTSCLDLLGCLMEHLGLEYLRMDGSTAAADRQELIDRFNQNNAIPIFLLSTKACGLGINLTAADTCIIHDLDFNPFNDLQAEDRCHRIGQKKKVTVFKMVAKDCVDADIYEMQERKAKMNAAIMESNSEKMQKKEMLQHAMDRYLSKDDKSNVGDTNNKENKVICLI